MGLCGVFDVGDVVFLAPVDQSVVTHLPVEVDGNDGFGVGRSCRLKSGEVNAPVVRFHVDEDGRSAGQRHAGRRGNVGHGRDKHFVAWTDVQQTQGCPQSHGTALARRALNGVAVGRKFPSERFALRSFDPVQGIQRSHGG